MTAPNYSISHASTDDDLIGKVRDSRDTVGPETPQDEEIIVRTQLDSLADELLTAYPGGELFPAISKLLGYNQVPPSVEEFIDDDKYLGRLLRDIKTGNSAVYEVWRQALRHIYPNPFYSPYIEVVATGAIGTGKSTFSKIGMCYDLLKLCMIDNPQARFDLFQTTIIEYAIISIFKTTAEDVLFNEVYEWFQLSPVFRNFLGQSNGKTLFPNGIDITIGSRSKHILGRAIFGTVLSEANFQSKASDQAYNNYTNAKRRMYSRFMQKGGRLPGHLWLDSSHSDETDWLDDYLPVLLADPKVSIFDYSLWEVKPWKFSSKTFDVFVGDGSRDPVILTDPTGREIHSAKEFDPEKILRVPIDVYDEFVKDIFNSLRDLAGRSTISGRRFIPSVSHINKVMRLKNWFDREVILLDLVDRDDRLINYINMERLVNRLHFTTPRFIHYDLALNGDRAGIAIGHIGGFLKVQSMNFATGLLTVTNQPWYIVDCVIAIEAKSGQEIPLYKLRDFAMDLAKSGVPMGGASADGWQSAQLKQELIVFGIPAVIISCDRDMGPYTETKESIYQDRILLPIHEILRKEFKELVREGNKVDHPQNGSKDVSDGVAGCVQNMKNNSDRYSMLLQLEDMGKMNKPGQEYIVE